MILRKRRKKEKTRDLEDFFLVLNRVDVKSMARKICAMLAALHVC